MAEKRQARVIIITSGQRWRQKHLLQLLQFEFGRMGGYKTGIVTGGEREGCFQKHLRQLAKFEFERAHRGGIIMNLGVGKNI